MTYPNELLLAVATVFGYMNIMFLLALKLKRNDIVDIAWGMGFVMVAVSQLVWAGDYPWRKLLISGLVALWGLRLAIHLYFRNKGKQEDFRYAQWRRDWGKHWKERSYLQVFLLQGFFMLIVSYPLFKFGAYSKAAFGILDAAGLLLWLFGFFFEAVGDYQLLAFKKQPANKGRIMNIGLWKYTRHPNYFGESVMWWAIFLLVLGSDYAMLAIISPITITWLLVRVSGVPMLEKKYAANPEYQAYIRNTSSFIPRFWRKAS